MKKILLLSFIVLSALVSCDNDYHYEKNTTYEIVSQWDQSLIELKAYEEGPGNSFYWDYLAPGAATEKREVTWRVKGLEVSFWIPEYQGSNEVGRWVCYKTHFNLNDGKRNVLILDPKMEYEISYMTGNPAKLRKSE